ncbi:MAG: hypothetical protein K0Q57_411 [Gammaproteobacteria bacterium]|jgi:hypothetical protein|nr:hypothetical protein [Gammaproteobacteria bacterium]
MLKLFQVIIDYDPGLVKFKRGVKSVVAVLITLLLVVTWVPPIGIIFTCLAGVFAGLSYAGETIREQKTSMILAIIYFTLSVALGLSLQSYFWIANAILIVLSFLAFYIAKFGIKYRGYPVIATILYLLSINFMLPGLSNKLLVLLAMLLSGGSMFIISFYFWPQRPRVELANQIETLFERYIVCVEYLYVGVNLNKPEAYFQQAGPLFAQLEKKLEQESQLLDRTYMSRHKELLGTLLVKQYALYVLLQMASTWLASLASERDSTKLEYQQAVAIMLKEIRNAFLQMKKSWTKPVQSSVIDKVFVETAAQFKQAIFDKSNLQGPALVQYSYLAFGLSRTIALLEFIQGIIEQLRLQV